MAITKEYERKIDVFLTYLPKRAYKKIADTKSEGFLTYEKLSLDEAKAHEKETLIPGTECGKKWEYLWFFTKVQIPDGYEGSIINFKADYKEGTVFVNGKIVGAIDRRHREITLTKCAKSGEIFEIAMEVYAGHDGPVRMAEQKIQTAILAPGVPNEEFGDNINQLVIKDGEFGEFNNEIFLLETEIELLYDLYNILDKSTLRAASISKALKAVCNAVDIEAESE